VFCGQLLGLGTIDVKYRERMACPSNMPGHRRTHYSNTYKSNAWLIHEFTSEYGETIQKHSAKIHIC
jgi:hypothetical protein